MYITLRNEEGILIESPRHKIEIKSDGLGKMSTKFSDKENPEKVEDKLLDIQIQELIDKNVKAGWGKERFSEMETFIKDLVERSSQALRVDKNKLFALMKERCDYSVINYFQQCHFYDFKTAQTMKEEISKLNQEIYNLKREHKKEVIKLQKEITNAKNIDVEKCEAEASCSGSYCLDVNCPYCDTYQEVKELSDWSPSESYEVNQECESCGKIFSVTHDGSM